MRWGPIRSNTYFFASYLDSWQKGCIPYFSYGSVLIQFRTLIAKAREGRFRAGSLVFLPGTSSCHVVDARRSKSACLDRKTASCPCPFLSFAGRQRGRRLTSTGEAASHNRSL